LSRRHVKLDDIIALEPHRLPGVEAPAFRLSVTELPHLPASRSVTLGSLAPSTQARERVVQTPFQPVAALPSSASAFSVLPSEPVFLGSSSVLIPEGGPLLKKAAVLGVLENPVSDIREVVLTGMPRTSRSRKAVRKGLFRRSVARLLLAQHLDARIIYFEEPSIQSLDVLRSSQVLDGVSLGPHDTGLTLLSCLLPLFKGTQSPRTGFHGVYDFRNLVDAAFFAAKTTLGSISMPFPPTNSGNGSPGVLAGRGSIQERKGVIRVHLPQFCERDVLELGPNRLRRVGGLDEPNQACQKAAALCPLDDAPVSGACPLLR
jgi:hypothetical protein